jgi:geranylgeranyl diphosphate synthase type II
MRTSSGEFRTYLEERRGVVDAALERFLCAVPERPERLVAAMRYSVFGGGKRLRPILALSAFDAVGGEGDAVLAPACATELIHTYSLIHDDLPAMDDDDTRRGRPSCHVAFDEATAILAGDALLPLAFEIVAREGGLRPSVRAEIIGELASANGVRGMVAGQQADMDGEGSEATVDAVELIHIRKTARPLRASVIVGALAGGAPAPVLDALSDFGDAMGLAFQIADDLLDETGTAGEMGKAVGKDRQRGKLTYPAAAGIEGARRRAAELVETALGALETFDDRGWALREIARFVVERRS